jgi:hypothetical protein
MSTRFVSAQPLRVAAELNGAELASPMRRAIAFAVDLMLLVVPSLVVALGAATLALRMTDPRGLHALGTLLRRQSGSAEARHAAVKDLAPLLVRLDAEGLPKQVRTAVEDGDLDRAADELTKKELKKELMIAMAFSEHPKPKVGEGTVRFPLERLIPKVVRGLALYGVAALYFTFLTARRGRTLGKRLLGIRVVRLDGHRLSFVEALERFVGYLHIPGSLFLSLADFWRDPNGRLPQDRVVHTAVVRVRAKRP